MSIRMRWTARTLPRTSAIIPTITVQGCRRAKTIGFKLIGQTPRVSCCLRVRGFTHAYRKQLVLIPPARRTMLLPNGLERAVFVLDDLGHQLQKFLPCLAQHFPSVGGRSVIFRRRPLTTSVWQRR